MMKKKIVGLVLMAGIAVSAIIITGFSYHVVDAAAENGSLPVEIVVVASELPRDQPLVANPGGSKVRFEGGWALSSSHEGFGGFSGLVVDSENNSLVAISDKGDWWQASFDARAYLPPTAGIMQGYSPGAIADKKDLDAESLIRFEGGFLVSFEHNHRLEFVKEAGTAGAAPPLATIDFGGVSMNSGMEAITRLDSGQVLAFAERGRDGGGRQKAWLVSADKVDNIWFKPPVNFSPTDAATLPNGDVLVLLRHFSAIDGVAIKVHRIKAAQIVSGATLIGEEILHLTPEFSVDNMEGMDVVSLDGNTVRLVIISDDNFNSFQRTLLMMFDYDYR